MESRDGKLRQQRRNVPGSKNKPSQDYNAQQVQYLRHLRHEQAGNASGKRGGQIVQQPPP
jgi:hypothetical protein